MGASTNKLLSGQILLRVTLSGNATAPTGSVVQRVSTWVRAIEIGCFGPGQIRINEIQTQGNEVIATMQCERLSKHAAEGLVILLNHLSATQTKIDSIHLSCNGQSIAPQSNFVPPDLPVSIPFLVEYPADLRHFVRIEIEFRSDLTASTREAIFDALKVWDVLISAFGEGASWNRRIDIETRLLNPRIIEHEVNGYFASFECLHMVILLGLRLHPYLAIERMTLE